MKNLLTILIILFSFTVYSQNVRVLEPTDTTADFTVRIVDECMHGDIWVFIVNSRSDTKNETCFWNFVTKKEDFTIRYVEDDTYDFQVWYTDNYKLPIIRSEYINKLLYDKLNED